MSRPKVVRLRRKGGIVVQDCDVYIGRRQTQGGWNLTESEWANPHLVKVVGREEAIRSYKRDLYERVRDDPHTWIPKLCELEGKTLGCWCDPTMIRVEGKLEPNCHGEVIADLVEACCQIVNKSELPDAERVSALWDKLTSTL